MGEARAEYEVPRSESGVRAVARSAAWHRCVPGESGPQRYRHTPLSIHESRNKLHRDFPETLLHAAWRRLGGASAAITGRDGHRYRVIYPGRPADGAGPDFRDAVLLRDDGEQVHGNVEIHVRSSDWHSHGHTNDQAYNGVVLHVVGEESGPPVDTPSGVRIPLLVLGRELFDERKVHTDTPVAARSSVPLGSLDMATAGDDWFQNRVHGYSLQLAHNPEQALWEGALECLGYPSNKKGFRQLSERLDWNAVPGLAEVMPIAQLQEIFEWAAGFRARPPGAPKLSGKSPKWSARHGRPANRPRTRLKAAAAWAKRWVESGNLTDTFQRTVSQASSPAELASLFLVPAERGRVAALGVSRARDIVVNHLLPATCALATLRGDTKLANHARQLFAVHPLLSPNSITREASHLLEARGVNGKPRTAREQQGLIHIYRMAVASQRPEQQLPLV